MIMARPVFIRCRAAAALLVSLLAVAACADPQVNGSGNSKGSHGLVTFGLPF
jgi:hypothetical protein